jgi:hypothetical protein
VQVFLGLLDYWVCWIIGFAGLLGLLDYWVCWIIGFAGLLGLLDRGDDYWLGDKQVAVMINRWPWQAGLTGSRMVKVCSRVLPSAPECR